MDTIMITGAGPNGITGRLLREKLNEKYDILSPSSKELNLTDYHEVSNYFQSHKIDYIVHCATFRPYSVCNGDLLETNLKMYFNLSAFSDKVKKMVSIGSGAEYDKRRNIVNAREDELGKYMPSDPYGLSKYIINNHLQNSKNIYNLRLFGSINKYEIYSKNFISNVCAKIILNITPTIRRNCRFSFFDIENLSNVIEYIFSNTPKHKDYNVCAKNSYFLSDIVELIIKISNKKIDYKILTDGYDLEYTGCPERLLSETSINFRYSTIEESLINVYQYIKQNKHCIDYNQLVLSV